MEARAVSHPPEDVLLALGAGKLDDAMAEAIFFHVEVCPHCLKVASRLTGDSFLDKLRAARGYSCTPAPSKDLSTFPPAGNTASIPTTSELLSPTILPELRNHPQYEVLRELGRGGMGVVYLAKNKLMDRQEVLKVVNKQLLGDAGAAERFLREIRSAAQLIHPNIVTAFSALQAGELLLFSMEYVEGRDLAQVVKARGPLPAAHSSSYVLQAARGLQHAFEKGMVHRDIKPQNLILDGKKNIVKILDFGLAKATRTTGILAEGLTGLNMMMGTPDYMAPEQARDAANVDIRADIYSLGCTLYCLLAGRAPFVGGSLATKIAAHQLSEPDPIESLQSDLPPGLAEIVRKMMAKDPEQRYQKPEEVVQALTICFKGKGKQPTAKGLPVKVVTAKPASASKLSTRGEGKSIYEQKTVAPIAAPRLTMRERPSPVVALVKNEKPPLWRKKWLLRAGGAVALMLLALIGLSAAGVFKVKTADGILVVKVNEPDAEVFVDGEIVTVTWGDGGKTAEVHVKPGTRKVEVKKDGFSVDGAELTFKDGHREVFTARLLPVQVANANAQPEKSPASDTTKPNPPQVVSAADAAWFKEVAALPVNKQADAVAAKLKELNPGFDGNIEYKVEGGQVVSLEFSTVNVKTISPLRALPELRVLVCNGDWYAGNGQVADLTPLKGMKLTVLDCGSTHVADLSPLRGMPLTDLELGITKVSDLSPLKGMPLTRLNVTGCTQVTDLSPLKDVKLTVLHCDSTKVSDLSPLKDMKLTELWCDSTKVSDLSPLKDMKLTVLACQVTAIPDLSPLKDMKLSLLNCAGTPVSDLSPLKDMKLTSLNCGGTPVSDLSPLKDMKLTELICNSAQVSDLTPLKDMKLTCLRVPGTQVSNLSPLKDMKLTVLECQDTAVSDLSPLKDMKLTVLSCYNTAISDLSPLKEMPLKEVHCDFKPERDAEILRSIRTLEKINDKPAAQFWKELPPGN